MSLKYLQQGAEQFCQQFTSEAPPPEVLVVVSIHRSVAPFMPGAPASLALAAYGIAVSFAAIKTFGASGRIWNFAPEFPERLDRWPRWP